MSRVTHARLLRLAEEMGARERDVVRVVDRLRLVSHAQLSRLMTPTDSAASSASVARTNRRVLAGLVEHGALARLDRRIGGVRAGSAGHVYYVGPVGQRLIAYWDGDGLVRGRRRPEPGSRYVRHRLAVSELYVTARERQRGGELDLLAFDVEPDCWRASLDGFGSRVTLKPDAFVRIGVGAFEDRWFVEVDLGTESRTVLAAKLRTYIDYFHTGSEQAEHGVFPRVLFAASAGARRAAIVEVCAGLPAEYWKLFAVTTMDRGIDVIAAHIEDEADQPTAGESA